MSDDSLQEFAEEGEVIQEITAMSRQLSRARTEASVLKAQVRELEADLDQAEIRSQLFTPVSYTHLTLPTKA